MRLGDVVMVAACGAILAVEVRRCRRAEAKVVALQSIGRVDLEPVVTAMEETVEAIAAASGVRPTARSCRRSDRPELRVLP